MCAGQLDHQYERQVPEEDKQMAAPRSHAKLLQVVSSPDPGAHQGQAPQHDADRPMVGDHACVTIDSIIVAFVELQAKSLLMA